MKFANPLDKQLSLKVKFQYWVFNAMVHTRISFF